LGKYFRFLWEEKDLLVIEGWFPEVAVSRKLYEERYRIAASDEDADRRLVQLMGASALAAVSLSDRESWGWTVSFADDPMGYFVGVEPEGMLCGRVREAERDRNTVYVQRQKASEPMTQSYFEPETSGPAAVVQQYFEQTVQVETRVALDGDASGVLVQALPNGRLDDLEHLDDQGLLALSRKLSSEKILKPMGEVLIFYECRCDDEMVLNMVAALSEDARREVWGDETQLSVECPRCGRGYEIQRPLH
jgi:hypothetical protein